MKQAFYATILGLTALSFQAVAQQVSGQFFKATPRRVKEQAGCTSEQVMSPPRQMRHTKVASGGNADSTTGAARFLRGGFFHIQRYCTEATCARRRWWHIHPGGQQLLITDGVGYYQERNKPLETVRKGDAFKCPPGVEHWHGATPDTWFTYVAVTEPQPQNGWMGCRMRCIFQN